MLVEYVISHLCEGICQGRIHSGSSFSIEDCSFHIYNWLHCCRIFNTKKENSSIHRTNCIEEIPLLRPGFKIFKITFGRNYIGKNICLFVLHCNLRFGAKVPEHCPKHQGYHGCIDQPYGSVWWIAPIGPMLFP